MGRLGTIEAVRLQAEAGAGDWEGGSALGADIGLSSSWQILGTDPQSMVSN